MKKITKHTDIYLNKSSGEYFNWDEHAKNKRDVSIYDADTYDENSGLMGHISDPYIRVNYLEELKRIRKQKIDEIEKEI